MPKASFPRSARLCERSQFLDVKRRGKSLSCNLFVLNALLDESLGRPRIGIITTRKSGGAVQRARMRRLLREVFRRNRHQLVAGLWIVAIGRAPLALSNYANTEREWLRLARSLSILGPAE